MENEQTSYRAMSRVILVATAFVLMVSVNALANILPIGGQLTGAVSDRYTSMFTPAGFTFAIWGVIYSGLLLFVVVQALPRFRRNTSLYRMDVPFAFNGVLNSAWIVAWHYNQLILSLVIMLGLLWNLIVLYRASRSERGLLWRLGVSGPISLYFAWICMATLANMSILQSAFGWNDVVISETIWTLLKLGAAGTMAVWIYTHFRDAVFVGVVAWAAWGIQAARVDGGQVGQAALALAVAGVVLVVVHLLLGIRRQISQTT